MTSGTPSIARPSVGMRGLMLKHVYSLLSVIEMHKVKLVKMRNPHGTSKSWKGDYCVGSTKWREKGPWNLLEPVNEEEGEFYMSYTDYVEQFQDTTICNLRRDVVDSSIIHDFDTDHMAFLNLKIQTEIDLSQDIFSV